MDFPIHSGPGFVRPEDKERVPWALVEPHRAQALRNHGQTLERLAERGGLCWSELAAVIEDRSWHRIDEDAAEQIVRDALAALPI